MAAVYVYLMNTMADWEIGNITSELNSKRFFRKDAPEIAMKTFALSGDSIRSMGGLTIMPDISMDSIEIRPGDLLILPGSDEWGNKEHAKVIDLAREFLDRGASVAAICGATVALAERGMLDERPHTSNGTGFLEMMCPNYRGSGYYVDMPSVWDDDLITAGCTGGLLMAKHILQKLDVFSNETAEAWYNYFLTGKAEYFFALSRVC